jgi:RNA polymerase sigma factor (sigma-70 family)
MERSDEELVLACGQGNDEAWALLVARYQRLLFAIPRRAGLDEETSADILQQTFLRLLENLRNIKQPALIHAWLVTTARRETLSFLRQRQTSRQVSLEDNTPEGEARSRDIPANEPLADEVLLEMETQHRVRLAVMALGDTCRRLLTLLFYQPEQPSYTEVARSLEIKEGSIGPMRARCLQKLHDKLHKIGGGKR